MTAWELAKGLFLKDLLDAGVALGLIALLALSALLLKRFGRKG